MTETKKASGALAMLLEEYNTDMRPTDIQLTIIDSILGIIRTWKNTNDLQSPTRYVDIREFLYADLEEYISDEQIEGLDDKLSELLMIVKDN